MNWLWLIVGVVAFLRLAELVYARRNTARLMARGATEVGASHYPAIVTLHAAWLASMLLFEPHWTLLAIFLFLQAARLWVIASLGPFWTTRVITLPDAPLIRHGPYRWFRHPNYLVVALEIAVLPLTFGAWEIALLFSILNGAILFYRIRIEDLALARRRSQKPL